MSRARILSIAASIATLTACGGDPPRATSARALNPDASAARASDAGARRAEDAGDPLWVDERSIAPGMREVLRKEVELGAAKGATLAVPTSAEVDTCARVAVRSLGKVRAKLIGPAGISAEGLVLAERGPVCVKKGEPLTVELAAEEPARARVIIWVSP